ncbi:hypothetical protein GE061_012799 [Apolygus lucorum]|uniref:Uncharacterized protein n=1 Tax=Apolygus lucorum TaxID=248454 RepID=A0A8S9XTK3_APOLU|nr:hypothetical protein GE061_012799 [Apolygus lucorum]
MKALLILVVAQIALPGTRKVPVPDTWRRLMPRKASGEYGSDPEPSTMWLKNYFVWKSGLEHPRWRENKAHKRENRLGSQTDEDLKRSRRGDIRGAAVEARGSEMQAESMTEELNCLVDVAIFSVYLLTRDLTIIAARKVKQVTKGRSSDLSLKYTTKCNEATKEPKMDHSVRVFSDHSNPNEFCII